MELALLLLGAAVLGGLLGCATGLLPGLHVNTLAVLLLATAPAFATFALAAGLPADGIPLLVAALILAITVSHTFINIVPATYLGAPDDSTALTILPAHRMLLRGHGYHACAISAYASFAALALSLLLFWPAAWLLSGPPALWDRVRAATPFLLILLVAFLVLREPARLGGPRLPDAVRHGLGRLAGLGLFIASGLFGWFSFRLAYEAYVPLPPSPLLPALSGLFGAATLLEALAQQARIPHQFLRVGGDRLAARGATAALGAGVVAGAGMSLFPGLTNTTATAVAASLRRGNDAEILVSLGAVNTANAVFNLLVLFERARSGAVVAVERLLPLAPWAPHAPAALVWLLFVGLAAGLVSLVATLLVARFAARRIHRVPYRGLVQGVLAYVTLIVVLFSGWMGLLVFVTGAALGLLTVRAGLQRTHLTGVLLLPVFLYLWNLA